MSLEAEEDETACGSSSKDRGAAPMELLDEYWFFSNALNARKALPMPPSPVPEKKAKAGPACRCPSAGRTPPLRVEDDPQVNGCSIQGTTPVSMGRKPSGRDRAAGQPLFRAPSMPLPCAGLEAGAQEEEGPMPTHMSRLKLRHSLSSLDSHSPVKNQKSCPSMTRQHRAQGDIMAGRDCGRALQHTRWRSSSDLESIEVQGFKDLGFVFDAEELKESLATVIPGLRERKASEEEDVDGGSHVTRPYLSEAWYVRRSAPPILKWAGKTSAAEAKDQIRFWARAVACNVRQEC